MIILVALEDGELAMSVPSVILNLASAGFRYDKISDLREEIKKIENSSAVGEVVIIQPQGHKEKPVDSETVFIDG